MTAAREQLLRDTAAAATALRELALAYPVEADVAYPVAEVLRQLNDAHRQLLTAVAGYPHALSEHPDTGASDEAGYLLSNLVSAVSRVVVRYHGQREFRLFDRDTFPLALRDVLVQASMYLAKLGPLDIDAHQYALRLAPADADPRWQAAVIRAAALAEGSWTRAVAPERTVHEIGVAMLAVSLVVVATEYRHAPDTISEFRVRDLLDPVATDRMWADGGQAAVDESLPVEELRRQRDRLHAERDERMAALTARIDAALVLAEVDLCNPGPPHRELVRKWRYLQQPAPEDLGSDLGINGYAVPYTWRPHLAEGAVRALEYLTSNPLSQPIAT